jgi:hypothetical protein
MECCFLQKTSKMSSYFIIDPDSDEFMWWLQWLAEEKDWSALEVVDAVYYSHKYQELQKEYLKTNES